MKADFRFFGSVSTGIVITASVVLSVYCTVRTPDVVPADAAATEFSAERAAVHVSAIAGEPRPVGSVSIDGTARYIENELRSLGLEPVIQRTTMNNRSTYARCRNILARIRGTGNGDAILLSAHYDGVPFSPGASDDGMGVASLLETVRALLAGSRTVNDVIVLFTNPEETGLQGAAAFVKEHPWAVDVKLAVNLDAGGISGAAYLVDTGPGNERQMKEYALSGAESVGNGAGQAFGNPSSDFDVFKAEGIKGFFFSLITDRKIHSILDTYANLDMRGLQQMGNSVLSVVGRFGNLDLNRTSDGNAAYFGIGSVLMRFSSDWALPLAAVVFVLFAAVMGAGIRKRLLTIPGTALGGLVFIAASAAAALSAMALWRAVAAIHPVYRNALAGHTYGDGLFRIVFIGAAVAVVSLAYHFARKKISAPNLSMGVQAVVLPISIVLSFFFPTAAYVVTLPAFFGLAALGSGFYLEKDPDAADSPLRLILSLLAACVSVLLVLPPVTAGFLASDLADGWRIVVFLMFLFAFLVPNFLSAVRVRAAVFSGVATLVAAVSMSIALTATFDEHHPQLSGAFYLFDADAGRAFLGTGSPYDREAEPDRWVKNFFTGKPVREPIGRYVPNVFSSGDRYFLVDAPAVGLVPPTVETLGSERGNGVLSVTLRITPAPGTAVLSAYKDRNLSVESVVVDGRPRGSTANPEAIFIFHDPPAESMDVTIAVKENRSLGLMIVAQSHGLPPSAVSSAGPIPADVIPFSQTSPFAWKTTVLKRFSF